MRKIKFFYGLSGTFKTATISSISHPNSPIVWSMIKLWKDLESGIFDGKTEKNHLNFAILHLCNLENIIKSGGNETIYSERGVSDPLFYYMNGRDFDWFEDAVYKERDLCEGLEIEKTLLIQKDVDFIENTILKEPHRKAIFPSAIEYMEQQERYIKFTKKYNKIDNIIEINNAKDYITSLGKTFNNKNN